MQEEILKRFFDGQVTADELAKDVAGSVSRVGPITSVVSIRDMDHEFRVTRPMLISLCDEVLAGSLPAEALATIGFALEASDKFVWDADDDELVAEVIADWSCPEVNYPLTIETVSKFRVWLIDLEPYPAKPSGIVGEGRIISIKEKKKL